MNLPRVGEIMTRRPLELAPETPVTVASRALLRRKLHAAPVVGPDRSYRGTFSLTGLMRALVHALHDALPASPVSAHLDAPAPTMTVDTPLLTAAGVLCATGCPHALLVVVGEGRLVGIVTRTDISQAVLATLGRGADPATLPYWSARDPSDAPFRSG